MRPSFDRRSVCKVQSSETRIQVEDSLFWFQGLGSGVQVSKFRIQDSGFRCGVLLRGMV